MCGSGREGWAPWNSEWKCGIAAVVWIAVYQPYTRIERSFDFARFTQGRSHAITGYFRYRHSPCASSQCIFHRELWRIRDKLPEIPSILICIRESLGSFTTQHVDRVCIDCERLLHFSRYHSLAIWSLRALLFQFHVVSLKWNLISKSLYVESCVCVCAWCVVRLSAGASLPK